MSLLSLGKIGEESSELYSEMLGQEEMSQSVLSPSENLP